MKKSSVLTTVLCMLLGAGFVMTWTACDKSDSGEEGGMKMESMSGGPQVDGYELTEELTQVLDKEMTELPDEGLIDKDGEPFTFEQMTGKPTLVTAIYTSCPMKEMCPLLTSKVGQVQEHVRESGEDYQIVLLSFDPETDTPEKLREYADKHNLDVDENVQLVTGDKETIDVVMKDLEIGAKQVEDGTYTHNMRTYLTNSSGAFEAGFRQAKWKPGTVAESLQSLD